MLFYPASFMVAAEKDLRLFRPIADDNAILVAIRIKQFQLLVFLFLAALNIIVTKGSIQTFAIGERAILTFTVVITAIGQLANIDVEEHQFHKLHLDRIPKKSADHHCRNQRQNAI